MTTIKTVVEHYEDLIQHYKNVIEHKDETIKRLESPIYYTGCGIDPESLMKD